MGLVATTRNLWIIAIKIHTKNTEDILYMPLSDSDVLSLFIAGCLSTIITVILFNCTILNKRDYLAMLVISFIAFYLGILPNSFSTLLLMLFVWSIFYLYMTHNTTHSSDSSNNHNAMFRRTHKIYNNYRAFFEKFIYFFANIDILFNLTSRVRGNGEKVSAANP